MCDLLRVTDPWTHGDTVVNGKIHDLPTLSTSTDNTDHSYHLFMFCFRQKVVDGKNQTPQIIQSITKVSNQTRQLGNLARHNWDTLGAQMKHSWGTKLKTLGHSRGTVGAQQ